MAAFEELRAQYETFRFERYEIMETEDAYQITYFFEIEGLSKFTPTWSFPKNKTIPTDRNDAVFRKLIFSLGMVELISYWKLTCSPKVVIEAGALTKEQIAWWKDLYFHGLGEFFYVNGITTDIDSMMEIWSTGEEISTQKQDRELKGTLIPVGGGKDSSVTMELCKATQADNYCFGINPRGAVLWSVEAGGYTDRMISVKRTLDKRMIELNGQGFLNGHTPFSALVAFSSVLSAYLNGLQYVALSNESSANESTVPGSLVNHQYSKSFRFEKAFHEYELSYIGSGVHYFSMLRPLSEFQIAWYFAKCEQYHMIFRSCNAGSKTDSWCCNCPKCLFVFLIMSPFIELERLTEMFGENLLEKESLLTNFEELVGIRDVKPFECVGSRNEVCTALMLFIDREEKAGRELPYLARVFKQQGLYAKQKAIGNQYETYFDEENLLPDSYDKLMRREFQPGSYQIAAEQIRGKRILILGMGREGRSTLAFLRRIGGYASITVADANEVKGLEEDVLLISGKDYQAKLDEYDLVFKSPGVVLKKPFEEYKCTITSQTEMFLRCFGKQTIGITGTKGKSTTTALIYHALKQGDYHPVLCGNIGIPPLDLFFEMRSDSIAVFEMSCHQLEYTSVSPHIGILLNLHEEHLDHYGSYEKYVAAKCNIFVHMKTEDILYINMENLNQAKNCKGQIQKIAFVGDNLTHDATKPFDRKEQMQDADVLIDSARDSIRVGAEEEFLIPTEKIQLLGHHNEFNIGIAYAVCRQFGMTRDVFERALISFESLPHRLKFLGVKDGVRYYDDSISTICETTIQALNSVDGVETLLIGGMDRGIDYQSLIAFLAESDVENIICMYATGKRIYEEAKESNVPNIDHFYVVENLEEAVELAKNKTKAGGACVLSPAAASYGYFKNFEERGEVFQTLAFR